MKLLKSHLLIILILTCMCAPLSAQSKSIWLSQNINNDDGLSNSAVTKVFMDSKGMLWLGTWDGLNMYNGTQIRVFKPDILQKGSISNNIIYDILEDNDKNLWILTGDGLNRLNTKNMRFKTYFSESEDLPVKELNMKYCFGPEAEFLLSVYGYGLTRYNPANQDFEKIKLPEISENEEKELIGVYSKPGHAIFLLTENGGLYAYTIDNKYTRIYSKDLSNFNELLFNKHWFITINNVDYLVIALKDGGAFLYNLKTHLHMELLEGEDQTAITTVNSAIDSTFFWIGTDGGSIYKATGNNTIALEKMDSYFPDLLSNQVKIWTVEQTSEDLLWIGTDGMGVFRYITKGKPFYNIHKGNNKTGSISHNIVRAIHKDKRGNLWIGTRGDGLNMIPSNGSNTRHYNTKNGLSNNAVIALNRDNEDNLWIGIDGEGIDMLEKNSGHIFHFPADFSNAGTISFGSVYAICVDVYGAIWLGTSGYGVINFEISKNTTGDYTIRNFHQINSKSGEKGLSSDIVYSIVEERPNVLWIGTRGGGLCRLNTTKFTIEVFGEASKDANGLNNDDILSLCMGQDAQLWIGTSGGLNKLNLAYKPYRFQNFTEYNGLPNNTIHGILQDNEDNIWVSSNRGLSKFTASEGSFTNYNQTDGLQSNEYTDGAVYNDTANNLLYFGGVEGIDWFNPQQIKASNQFPPIVLNEFRLYNNVVIPGDSTMVLSNRLDETDTIVLKYNQNFFSLSFTTLNYFNSQKCEFTYILEGFDMGWNYIRTERTASFTNVPPGTYNFKLKATNEDGVYGDEIRSITIEIKPPVWNTVYAYILYVFLLGLLLFGIISYFKTRTKEKRQIELEKLNRQKEEEINQYKLQFFTNIAHEFRTPLTLILAPAVTLMSYIEKDSRLSIYARSIYQNANRLQRLIQELIEFRKVETGNMKLEVRKCELVNYVGELVKAFDHFALQNGVSIHFIHSQPAIEAWVDIKILEKILLNLISNAIKYTPKGGAIHVKLDLQNKNILFMVSDTGIGIPEDLREKIFDRFFHLTNTLPKHHISQEGSGVGLALTKSLVEIHRGTIFVDNALGGGSIFNVLIPYEKEIYGDTIMEDDSFIIQRGVIAQKVIEEFQIPHDFPLVDAVKILHNKLKKYTILIVDDNPQVCNLISGLLVDAYNIFTANNGDEALSILKIEHIDLLVSDIIMPNMDGLELCEIVKSDIHTSHIPVILLTAKGELEQRIEGLEAGADSYIPKPFHPKHLIVRIEKLLEARELFRKTFKDYDPQQQSELLQGLSPKDRSFISGLIDYIDENLDDPQLNADNLVIHQAMSKTQLYRKVKALTDLTPNGLIKHIRLKMAAGFLKEGNKTVMEVFYETGFNNRTYFYRSFRDAYGLTPGEYKKEHT